MLNIYQKHLYIIYVYKNIFDNIYYEKHEKKCHTRQRNE
jgi:hypothetical protein